MKVCRLFGRRWHTLPAPADPSGSQDDPLGHDVECGGEPDSKWLELWKEMAEEHPSAEEQGGAEQDIDAWRPRGIASPEEGVDVGDRQSVKQLE